MSGKAFKYILFLFICSSMFPQEKKGYVTYQSSQFIYVKFDDTKGININDTLYVKDRDTLLPVLLSSYISTRSCACKPINSLVLKNGTEIIVKVKENSTSELVKGTGNNDKPADVMTLPDSPIKTKEKTKQNTITKNRLKLSVQSYSTTSNISGFSDRQQWRYLFSTDFNPAENIPLTLSSYLTYRYRPGRHDNTISNNLNVYDLSLQYEFDNDFNITLGRKINGYISNISTIDGIQLNKKWGTSNIGIILGSRPDLNYSSGINLKLFETGVYLARTDTALKGTIDNTLAFFEQTNSFKTDRRFIYFQHRNNIFNDFYTFISSEFDLYLREKGKSRNVFNLTDLFLLLQYKLNRELNFSASYDNRRNIIYYETFKNGLDSLIDRETRQGIRIELGYHPLNNVAIRAGGGYNFKKSDLKPTRNLTAGLSLSNLTALNFSGNLSFTSFENSFISGNIYGVTFSKEMLNGNLYPSVGYRISEYKMSLAGKTTQNYFSLDLSLRLLSRIFFSANYELEFEHKTCYNRFLLGLSTRVW